MFTEKDEKQIAEHGLTREQIDYQIGKFKSGFPPSQLEKPAIVGDGIVKFTDDQIEKFVSYLRRDSCFIESCKVCTCVRCSVQNVQKPFCFYR